MNQTALGSIAILLGTTGLGLGTVSFLSKPSRDKIRAQKLIRIGFLGITLLFISSLMIISLYAKHGISNELRQELQDVKEELPDVSMLREQTSHDSS